MLIKQITLQNFRQFKGKQGLVFATDPNQNVTVLLGENTFGKNNHSAGIQLVFVQ